MKKVSNITEAKIDKKLVEALESALTDAKEGKLVSMAAVGLWEIPDTRFFKSMFLSEQCPPFEMLGALEFLKNEFWAYNFTTEEDTDEDA